jgi:hypothetical protein
MKRVLFFTAMALVIAVFSVSGCKKKAEEGEVMVEEAVEGGGDAVILEEPLKLEGGEAGKTD